MDYSITTFGAVTPRERQRRNFFDNLSHELEKVAAVTDSVNVTLCNNAEAYFSDGATPELCIDLLILDGFSAKSARDYVNTRTQAATVGSTIAKSSMYDFMFKDHRGRLIRGSEIGRSVVASSDSESLERARVAMSCVEPPVEVIEVTKML